MQAHALQSKCRSEMAFQGVCVCVCSESGFGRALRLGIRGTGAEAGVVITVGQHCAGSVQSNRMSPWSPIPLHNVSKECRTGTGLYA